MALAVDWCTEFYSRPGIHLGSVAVAALVSQAHVEGAACVNPVRKSRRASSRQNQFACHTCGYLLLHHKQDASCTKTRSLVQEWTFRMSRCPVLACTAATAANSFSLAASRSSLGCTLRSRGARVHLAIRQSDARESPTQRVLQLRESRAESVILESALAHRSCQVTRVREPAIGADYFGLPSQPAGTMALSHVKDREGASRKTPYNVPSVSCQRPKLLIGRNMEHPTQY